MGDIYLLDSMTYSTRWWRMTSFNKFCCQLVPRLKIKKKVTNPVFWRALVSFITFCWTWMTSLQFYIKGEYLDLLYASFVRLALSVRIFPNKICGVRLHVHKKNKVFCAWLQLSIIINSFECKNTWKILRNFFHHNLGVLQSGKKF